MQGLLVVARSGSVVALLAVSRTVCPVQKRGCVRIRQEFRVEVPFYRYSGSWQPEPNTPPPLFYSEDGPGWDNAEEAIRWARVRAPIVYVGIGEGASEHFNAGERDGSGATERWPRVPRRAAANRHPDYAGIAWVTEEQLFHAETNEFNALWVDDESAVLERATFESVDAAIDWARERAPVVLVAEADWSGTVRLMRVAPRPVYKVSSAGDEDPARPRLPRLRPRAGETDLRWEHRIQLAARALTPAELADRLQDALAADPTVVAVTCSVNKRPPRSYSIPALLTKSAELQAVHASVKERRPQEHDWVTIAFQVAAPTRRQAWPIAIHALHRALTGAGEHASGWFAEKDLVQVD